MRLKVGQMVYNYSVKAPKGLDNWRLPIGTYKIIAVRNDHVCVKGSAAAIRAYGCDDTDIILSQERFLVRRSFLAYNPQNKSNRSTR